MDKQLEDLLVFIYNYFDKKIVVKCAEEIIIQKNKKKIGLAAPSKVLSKSTRGMSKYVMLAHTYDEDKHAKKVKGWYISVKYDGVRGFWDGSEMKSRTDHVYTLPDFITKQLMLVKDEDGSQMQLDGEIWFGNDTFAIASGAARRYENDPELWKQMIFMVFDIPIEGLPFEERIKKLGAALKKVKDKTPNIRGVKHVKFDSEATTIADELKKVEDEGGEGLVLRKPGSMYVFDRSHDMPKVKTFNYKEAVVTGYVEGKGKYEGMVGSLEVTSEDFENEETGLPMVVHFKVGSGLNDWQKYSGGGVADANWKKKETQQKIDVARKLHAAKKPIDKESETYKNLVNTIKTETGKVRSDALHRLNELFTTMPVLGDTITFRYKELTKTGAPSFPTFVGVRDYE